MERSTSRTPLTSLKKDLRKRGKEYCSKERWMERFPISIWAPKYNFSKGLRDLIAGFTVGLTVIPQGLAYANIAKLPLEYGLYSAFMGGFVYMFLGMSKDITVGPTAIMSLLVAGYGEPLGDAADDLNDPTYAILLAFFCGIVQLFMGIFHLGFVTNYISHVVVSGFTSASAITIGFGQVKNILGIKFSAHGFLEEFIETFKHIKDTRWQDVVLGIVSIIFLILLRFLKNWSQGKIENLGKKPPVAKIVHWKLLWILGTARNAVCVILTGALAYGLMDDRNDIIFTITGNVTEGLPPFSAPNFKAPNILKVLESGLIIVPLIGFLENIAIARGFARQNDYRVESNQELIALGTCNVAGSFVSAYPVTGSFSRSAINSQSDVASPASGIVTGFLVLLAIAFLTPAFYYIPKASLAAVIIYAVIFMIDYKIVPELWHVRKIDLIPLGATFFFSLWLGVEYGTLIGIGVDLVLLMLPYAKPKTVVKRKNHTVLVELERGLRYPAVDKIESLLDEECIMRDDPSSVLFDFTYISAIDYSMLETLKLSAKAFQKKGQTFGVANCRRKISDLLIKANIEGMDIYDTMEDALSKMGPSTIEVNGDEVIEAHNTLLQ
ncbi:sodium-independent sulfate anion transporter-like isoform X2 [Apostichopus japonicus]|uniref:sodium-independent sulfate anion transporter-like isoform X2 n=1 Tax=Stichopus japonicus TaxID=307972 RepID=UPI003AB5994E